MIQFKYTILYVNDVVAALDFYEKAFGFQRKFISPDNEYGELITGDTTLAFASKILANTNLKNGFIESDLSQKPFAMEIGFSTDNVEATVNTAVSSGAVIVEYPKTTSWGQVVAYVRDPNAFLIEICTPMDES